MPIEVLPEMTLPAPAAVPPTILFEDESIEIPMLLPTADSPDDVGADQVAQDLVRVRAGGETDSAARVARDDIAGTGLARRYCSRMNRSRSRRMLPTADSPDAVGADQVAQDLVAGPRQCRRPMPF